MNQVRVLDARPGGQLAGVGPAVQHHLQVQSEGWRKARIVVDVAVETKDKEGRAANLRLFRDQSLLPEVGDEVGDVGEGLVLGQVLQALHRHVRGRPALAVEAVLQVEAAALEAVADLLGGAVHELELALDWLLAAEQDEDGAVGRIVAHPRHVALQGRTPSLKREQAGAGCDSRCAIGQSALT